MAAIINAIEQMSGIVYADHALAAALQAILDKDEFALALIQAALTHGITLTQIDLNLHMQSLQRAWIERWL